MSLVKHNSIISSTGIPENDVSDNILYVSSSPMQSVGHDRYGHMAKGTCLISNGIGDEKQLIKYTAVDGQVINDGMLIGYSPELEGYVPINISPSVALVGNSLCMKYPIAIANGNLQNSVGQADLMGELFVNGLSLPIGETVYMPCVISTTDEILLKIYYDGINLPFTIESLMASYPDGVIFYKIGIMSAENTIKLSDIQGIYNNSPYEASSEKNEIKMSDCIYSVDKTDLTADLEWNGALNSNTYQWRTVAETYLTPGVYNISGSINVRMSAIYPNSKRMVQQLFYVRLTAYALNDAYQEVLEKVIYNSTVSKMFIPDAKSEFEFEYSGLYSTISIETIQNLCNTVFSNCPIKLQLQVRPACYAIDNYGKYITNSHFYVDKTENGKCLRCTFLDNSNIWSLGPSDNSLDLYSIENPDESVIPENLDNNQQNDIVINPNMQSGVKGERVIIYTNYSDIYEYTFEYEYYNIQGNLVSVPCELNTGVHENESYWWFEIPYDIKHAPNGEYDIQLNYTHTERIFDATVVDGTIINCDLGFNKNILNSAIKTSIYQKNNQSHIAPVSIPTVTVGNTQTFTAGDYTYMYVKPDNGFIIPGMTITGGQYDGNSYMITLASGTATNYVIQIEDNDNGTTVIDTENNVVKGNVISGHRYTITFTSKTGLHMNDVTICDYEDSSKTVAVQGSNDVRTFVAPNFGIEVRITMSTSIGGTNSVQSGWSLTGSVTYDSSNGAFQVYHNGTLLSNSNDLILFVNSGGIIEDVDGVWYVFILTFPYDTQYADDEYVVSLTCIPYQPTHSYYTVYTSCDANGNQIYVYHDDGSGTGGTMQEQEGNIVQVNVAPKHGWRLDHVCVSTILNGDLDDILGDIQHQISWLTGYDPNSGASIGKFMMPDCDVNVVARFERIGDVRHASVVLEEQSDDHLYDMCCISSDMPLPINWTSSDPNDNYFIHSYSSNNQFSGVFIEGIDVTDDANVITAYALNWDEFEYISNRNFNISNLTSANYPSLIQLGDTGYYQQCDYSIEYEYYNEFVIIFVVAPKATQQATYETLTTSAFMIPNCNAINGSFTNTNKTYTAGVGDRVRVYYDITNVNNQYNANLTMHFLKSDHTELQVYQQTLGYNGRLYLECQFIMPNDHVTSYSHFNHPTLQDDPFSANSYNSFEEVQANVCIGGWRNLFMMWPAWEIELRYDSYNGTPIEQSDVTPITEPSPGPWGIDPFYVNVKRRKNIFVKARLDKSKNISNYATPQQMSIFVGTSYSLYEQSVEETSTHIIYKGWFTLNDDMQLDAVLITLKDFDCPTNPTKAITEFQQWDMTLYDFDITDSINTLNLNSDFHIEQTAQTSQNFRNIFIKPIYNNLSNELGIVLCGINSCVICANGYRYNTSLAYEGKSDGSVGYAYSGTSQRGAQTTTQGTLYQTSGSDIIGYGFIQQDVSTYCI